MKWELLAACALVFGCGGEADSVHRTSGESDPVEVNDRQGPADAGPKPVQVIELPPMETAEPVATSEPEPVPTSEPVVDAGPPVEPKPEPEPMPEPQPEPEPTTMPTMDPPPPPPPLCDYNECYAKAIDQEDCINDALALGDPCERAASVRRCTARSLTLVSQCVDLCLDADPAITAESRCKAGCATAEAECVAAAEDIDGKCQVSECTATGTQCSLACYCDFNATPDAATCSLDE